MIVYNKVTWYSKLAALILFLVVIPSLAFYVGIQYQITKKSETIVIINARYTKDYSAQDGQLILVSPTGVRVLIPHDVAVRIDSASRDSATSKNDTTVITFGYAIINPKKQNQLILTTLETTSNPTEQNKCEIHGNCFIKNKFYTYDLDTRVLNMLYQVPDMKVANPYEYEILGTEDADLILVTHFVGTDSVCDNSWLQETDQYYYLDLNSVQGGIRPYVVAPQKIKQAQIDFDACVKGI